MYVCMHYVSVCMCVVRLSVHYVHRSQKVSNALYPFPYVSLSNAYFWPEAESLIRLEANKTLLLLFTPSSCPHPAQS